MAYEWARLADEQDRATQQAIGPDVLETLSRQTGLSREELLSRLSKNLPDAVDKYTPEGRIPTAAEFSKS